MNNFITVLLLIFSFSLNAQKIDIRKSNQGWIFAEGVLLNLAVTEIVDGELIKNYTGVHKGWLIVYIEKYKKNSKNPYLVTYVNFDGFVYHWRIVNKKYIDVGLQKVEELTKIKN